MSKDFPAPGLTYFWFLNDECRDEHIDRQIAEFAKGGVSTVCLHPRAGLLLPYGGDDWFAFIRRTVTKCAEAGLAVWLYDEDPYPSGNAGGWITAEDMSALARAIECFEAEPGLAQGELFCFPKGKLLWAGLVGDDAEPVDLAGKVRTVRRNWRKMDPWDSRYYYPATPLYPCARSDTFGVEFALKAPPVPDGMKLVAFVARPVAFELETPGLYADTPWGGLPDTLNPEVTELFIRLTHERYYEAVGDMFGDPITAIFTDEPKYFGGRPWTPGMFEGFAATYGYDLSARLYDLFSTSQAPEAIRTRLDYRQWCGKRFEEAWLKPVSQWCHDHNMPLVGHISPEDDLVEQANTISNLFPLQKYFDLAGLDLIIPAVGDADHPMINVGITLGTSVAQQQNKVGVMSESLGCSGLDFTAEQAGKILSWQTVLGMTTPVVHGAFSSTEGNRLIDAPPDFGPQSPRWEGMQQVDRSLREIDGKLIGATQVAPAAILWPVRSFQADATIWQAEPGGMRREFLDLLHACLSNQIGTHLLDEEDLWTAPCAEGRLNLGRAAYSFILIPSCKVLHERTIRKLQTVIEQGITVRLVGDAPAYQQTGTAVAPVDFSWCPRWSVPSAVAELPRLVDLAGDRCEEVRCTSWTKNGERFSLLINIGKRDWEGTVDGQPVALPVGKIEVLNH